MSAGHHDNPYPFTIEEAKRITSLSIVSVRMNRLYAVDRLHWDIPYLAGYSKDGKTIYIDRDLRFWLYQGRMLTTDEFLQLHEEVEKSLIDALHESVGEQLEVLLRLLRMSSPDDEIYYHCHGVATAIETHSVKLRYGSSALKFYNRFMVTQVKNAEDERIRRVPANLDMTPYEGHDKMDRHLAEAMRKHMVA